MVYLRTKRFFRKAWLKLFPKNKQQRMAWLENYGAEKLYPFVPPVQQTIDRLVNEHLSIARYGDGEYRICLGKGISFQEYDRGLAKRMLEILEQGSTNSCIVGIQEFRTKNNTDYWIDFWFENISDIATLLKAKTPYGNMGISREVTVEQMKSLCRAWENRNVVFVSGKGSRFKAEHELFKGIKSQTAIYGSPKNAWKEYTSLLASANDVAKGIEQPLFLIALGPTATVLAYDLAKAGIQAFDIGHITNVWDSMVYNAESPEKLKIE